MTKKEKQLIVDHLSKALEPVRTNASSKLHIKRALFLLGVECEYGIWGWQVKGSQYDTPPVEKEG